MPLPFSNHAHSSSCQDEIKPPLTYHELTSADLSLLARILVPCSFNPADRENYPHRLLTKLSTLPPHLCARHPLLSSFCPLHKPLSPLPISSLLAAIRHPIEQALNPATRPPGLDAPDLERLRHLAASWRRPRADSPTPAPFHAPPQPSAASVPATCAACQLAALAGDLSLLPLLGALTLGSLSVGRWKRSRRARWFEQWIHACALAENCGVRPEELVAEMLCLGLRLKRGQQGGVDCDNIYTNASGLDVRGLHGFSELASILQNTLRS